MSERKSVSRLIRSNVPALPLACSVVTGMLSGYFIGGVPQWLLIISSLGLLVLGMCLFERPKARQYPFYLSVVLISFFFMARAKGQCSVALPEGPVCLEGVVIDEPREATKTLIATFYVQKGELKGRKVRCRLPKDERGNIFLGQTYALTCRLRNFRKFGDSNFNYPRWAESHSLVAEASALRGGVRQIESGVEQLPLFERVAVKAKIIRSKVVAMYAREGISGSQFALLSAVAFGDKSHLSQSTRDAYAHAGVGHLLALSGMHLGILFAMLSFVFGRCRWKMIGDVVVITTVWAYVVLVGMPASVVRAATMVTIYAVATFDGRHRMSANALLVTVVVMLFCNPLMIWDISFQLSVTCMLSICCYYKPIYNLIGSKLLFSHPLLRKLWAMVALSIAAQLGAFPLSVYYFGIVPLFFLLANIVAVPLVSLLLYSVFLSLLCWQIAPLKWLFISLFKIFSAILDTFMSRLATWEWLSIDGVRISWIQMLILYVILVVATVMMERIASLWRRWRDRPRGV